jgi:hypothetical protein
MIATADSCKSNPQLEAESSLGPDSDSEEEDRLHSQMGLYKSSGPFSFILDDIRKMEINLGTIEDALLRGDIKKDGFSGKRGNDQLSIAPNTLLASLIGRSGSCCLLTDSHDYTVRRHQLRILSEEFSDIDFVKFIESCARGGIVSYNAITVQLAPKIKQLLLRLVDLERAYADGVFNCKQKDYPRAQEIITGMGDRGSEIDDTISRARIRADEIGICVHRVVSQL